MFYVYTEKDGHGAVGPIKREIVWGVDETEHTVVELAEMFPKAIYFERLCELVSGEGWAHVDPYVATTARGVQIFGCHNCGVRLVD